MFAFQIFNANVDVCGSVWYNMFSVWKAALLNIGRKHSY